MTPDRLRALGAALYGPEWQTPLADALGVALRTVARWASGYSAIPETVAAALEAAHAGWLEVAAAVPDRVALTTGRGPVGEDATRILADALERRGLDVRVVAVDGDDPERRAAAATRR